MAVHMVAVRGAILAALLAWPGALFGQTLFGYWDHAYAHAQNEQHIQATAPYTNVTHAVRWYVEADWQAAKAGGLGVVLMWPYDLWLTIDVDRPIMWNTPVWGGDALAFAQAVLAHRDQVIAFNVIDEPGCGYDGVGVYAWTADNCRRQGAKVEANIATIRAVFPWVKTMVIDSSMWANWFVNDDGTPRDPSRYGVTLPSADWIGLDCYTPFEQCFGRYKSLPTLVAGLVARMTAAQRVVLVPRAFSGSYLNYAPSDARVAATAEQYATYARATPRVCCVFPFIWWDLSSTLRGAQSSPTIRGAYEQIGFSLTGKHLLPPARVTGLRILR